MSQTTNIIGGGSNRYLEFCEPAIANYQLMYQKKAENRKYLRDREKHVKLFDQHMVNSRLPKHISMKHKLLMSKTPSSRALSLKPE